MITATVRQAAAADPHVLREQAHALQTFSRREYSEQQFSGRFRDIVSHILAGGGRRAVKVSDPAA